MGGFVRSIVRRVFRRPDPVVIQAPVQAAAPAQTAKKTDAKTASTMAASKAGKYGDATLMTEATGIEEEANVSKTALGGSSIKKKKKYA
tara:strand:+ start:653 stop:919 length:267 start_codon:yes stop_codon:yes gene_type:complete